MTWQTLWDLIGDAARAWRGEPVAPAPRGRAGRGVAKRNVERSPEPEAAAKPAPARRATRARGTLAQDRYDAMVREMCAKYGVRVRKWRSSMSGVAWELRYRDGSRRKLIESPKPKGPMSAAVFLHEIGHHAIGLGVHRPRCLEEYHAWAFSLRTMEEFGLNVTESVQRRMHQSLRYAVGKAMRRGLRELPPELLPYTKPWTPSGLRRGERRGTESGE